LIGVIGHVGKARKPCGKFGAASALAKYSGAASFSSTISAGFASGAGGGTGNALLNHDLVFAMP